MAIRARGGSIGQGPHRGGFRGNDEGEGDERGDQAQPLRVVALWRAKVEARDILDDFQYWWTVGLVKRLCDFGDREATSDLDIRQFGLFWELRLKGGPLKKINLRIYFAHVADHRVIVLLKAYKKEEDSQVSPHVMITLENRLEDYLAGRLGKNLSVYEPEPRS
jgi:hypothetical protein